MTKYGRIYVDTVVRIETREYVDAIDLRPGDRVIIAGRVRSVQALSVGERGVNQSLSDTSVRITFERDEIKPRTVLTNGERKIELAPRAQSGGSLE